MKLLEFGKIKNHKTINFKFTTNLKNNGIKNKNVNYEGLNKPLIKH